MYNLKARVPLPVFDQNRGNIMAAEGALARANHGYALARDTLASSLADAYSRYDANKITVDYYRKDIIRDQVQSWRGLWQRHQEDPDSVQFTDVVSARSRPWRRPSRPMCRRWEPNGKRWSIWPT